jgi:hypothetical protein
MTIDMVRRKQITARWHRRMALFVSLWLVVLAASGMAINHAHGLGLDRRPLPDNLQSLVYGIKAKPAPFCDSAAILGTDCASVFAQLPLPAGRLLVSGRDLFLLSAEGQLLEKLSVSLFGLDSLNAVLARDAHIYLRDASRTVRTDEEFLQWDVLSPEAAGSLTADPWQVRANSPDTVSWERLLLDLHAARFLGPFAQWFNDLVAVLILLLALSGMRMFRLRRNGQG